ncbi:MAG TPA: non-homologous end-joining DNA ligase [Vicinamibacterales bacterium]
MLLRPMLATSAEALPEGPAWTYEVKWDGYRALAVKDGPRVRLISRNQKDLTRDYPPVVSAISALRIRRVVLDGEIVALDADGRPSFQALQHRATSDLALVYYAFDVLEVGTESLIRESLDARRERLALLTLGSDVLRSEPLPGAPRQIEREIRRLGLEGVVAKRRDSLYRPGERSDAWVKVKFSPRQEFVIGGYKPADRSMESILVGYYQSGDLYFAGKVRAGLTPHLRAELIGRLRNRSVARCPFVNLPNSGNRSHWGEGITVEEMALLRWVGPTAVVEVSFVEWTRDGLLRHPRVLGLRDDKAPRTVRREKARFGGRGDDAERY